MPSASCLLISKYQKSLTARARTKAKAILESQFRTKAKTVLESQQHSKHKYKPRFFNFVFVFFWFAIFNHWLKKRQFYIFCAKKKTKLKMKNQAFLTREDTRSHIYQKTGNRFIETRSQMKVITTAYYFEKQFQFFSSKFSNFYQKIIILT